MIDCVAPKYMGEGGGRRCTPSARDELDEHTLTGERGDGASAHTHASHHERTEKRLLGTTQSRRAGGGE